MHSQFDDKDLMSRIAARDQQAIRLIYQQYGKAIYSLAFRVLQNTGLAEEVTQDALLKVWQQKSPWDPAKGNLKNWLLAITHYTAIDRLRQERRQPNVYPDRIEDMEAAVPSVSAMGDASWQDGIILRNLLRQMPKEQVTLIELAFFRGMTHSEIANETAIPLGTVKTRLRKGLQRLRELWLDAVKQTSTE